MCEALDIAGSNGVTVNCEDNRNGVRAFLGRGRFRRRDRQDQLHTKANEFGAEPLQAIEITIS
jgi:hypothetical protein